MNGSIIIKEIEENREEYIMTSILMPLGHSSSIKQDP